MSSHAATSRITPALLRQKKAAEPIVVLTSYTAPIASLLDAHVDMLLVGDSLGMVLYGMPSTLSVSLEMMIAHGKAVMGASKHACVIVDMPFGSYQQSPEQAFENCARVMAETHCQGIKLEGGVEMAPTVRFLTERAIPVVGHVGLTPQHVHRFGGFKVQGRDEASAKQILADAKAIEQAGAFSLVIEGVPEKLAAEITKSVSIPTIGIGASPACDGQVLVAEDMLGLNANTPRFVKRFAELREIIEKAAKHYADEVRGRKFPDKKNTYE